MTGPRYGDLNPAERDSLSTAKHRLGDIGPYAEKDGSREFDGGRCDTE